MRKAPLLPAYCGSICGCSSVNVPKSPKKTRKDLTSAKTLTVICTADEGTVNGAFTNVVTGRILEFDNDVSRSEVSWLAEVGARKTGSSA